MGKTKFYILLCILLVSVAGCGGGGGGGTASADDASAGSGPSVAGAASDTGAATGDTAPNGGTANDGTALLTLAWESPVGVDGMPLADVAGFRVHYGTAPGEYTTTVDVGPGTTYSVRGIPSGTYYFAVTDYDSSGNESGYSNEVSKTVP